MNVNYLNRNAPRVLRHIRETDPDIVVIIEANTFWMQQLAPLRASHRFVEGFTRPSGYGMLLFSRLPVEHSTREGLGQGHLPCIVARLTVDGRPITLIAAHPVSPTRARKAAYRNWQLAALGRLAASSDTPVVMIGDMNTTRWSPHFRLLLDGTGLRDTQQGRGTQVTWPVGWPLVGIAIDHCLVSRGISVHDRRVGPSIGSDHLPLLVEVALAS
jgi:endonuclease/exonuclease/phosphatase (EEP) superfamily protein YafD